MSDAKQTSIWDRLAEPFNPSCIEWLPKNVLKPEQVDNRGRGVSRALALSYIDARSVMARLDEVLGPENWRDSLRVEHGRTICRLEIRIEDEWVWREDVSGDTNFESEKGGASGALKRAAVKFGIGRYLYDVPEVWAECNVRITGQGSEQKVHHNGWTERGSQALEAALMQFAGPRETGKPSSVKRLHELIERAPDKLTLDNLYRAHWQAVPLEYRAETLRLFGERKALVTGAPAPGTQQQNNHGDTPAPEDFDPTGEQQ